MKEFNITGACYPEKHYMVDLHSRLAQIKEMIDSGKYFCISKGMQYGKTTVLQALEEYLNEDYIVISLDFHLLDSEDYQNDIAFVRALSREIWNLESCRANMSDNIQHQFRKMETISEKHGSSIVDLFELLSDWCDECQKKVILIVDEVDSASDYPILIDFFGQLRYYYQQRYRLSAFQSVILAGIYDIYYLQKKLESIDEYRYVISWNIASSFYVDMSFSQTDIEGMLTEYEADQHTGMDIPEIAKLIYDATAGYPILVSSFCWLMNKQIARTVSFPTKSSAWTKKGFMKAEEILLNEQSPLFDSIIDVLKENEKLRSLLYRILFNGMSMWYNIDVDVIALATMYGFVANRDGQFSVFNRIFETKIYEWFLSEERTNSSDFSSGDKNQFVDNDKLDVERILEKFIADFDVVYGSQTDEFKKEAGRKVFLLYLESIIDSNGYYYIESQTRDDCRMDIVVNYAAEQYIIELNIRHDEKCNIDDRKQFSDYLDYYHLKKGYLLTFSFYQNKTTGVRHVQFMDKELLEATV